MGEKLLDAVTRATGLPSDLITKELEELLQQAGHSPETLTIDQLRRVLTEYLQDVFLSVQEQLDDLK